MNKKVLSKYTHLHIIGIANNSMASEEGGRCTTENELNKY